MRKKISEGFNDKYIFLNRKSVVFFFVKVDWIDCLFYYVYFKLKENLIRIWKKNFKRLFWYINS